MESQKSVDDIKPAQIKKSLRVSIFDGISFAVMEGMTASFITPYALALNASVHLIAALTYVPQLIGALVHLVATKIVEVFRDRKKIVILASFLHACLWIPLLLIPYVTPSSQYLIVGYIALQTMLSELISPIWSSVMGELVPKHQRGSFFGFRNLAVGATSFVSAIVAGVLLMYLSPKNPMLGFTIIFLVACIGRILSTVFKFLMYAPPYDIQHAQKFTLRDFILRMDKTNYGHFVIYISLFKFAVSIASPFFAVYMLKTLHFSYMQFTIMTASELIASFIAMRFWGKIIDKSGTKSVLYVTGLLTPFVPLLWLFSGNFYYLIMIQLLSGFAWAGFNLGASNFIYDAVRTENRVRCISYYKFFESIAVVLGAALGGFLIGWLPAWIFGSGILAVFLISGILRLCFSVTLLPGLREARLIELGVGHSFLKRYLYIRPAEGIVFEVVGKFNKAEQEPFRFRKKAVSGVQKKQKKIPHKENPTTGRGYTKNILRFMGKNIVREKSPGDSISDIEKITENIERQAGRRK